VIAKKKNNFVRPHDLRGAVDECGHPMFDDKKGIYPLIDDDS
jgi:hypothetical protein